MATTSSKSTTTKKKKGAVASKKKTVKKTTKKAVSAKSTKKTVSKKTNLKKAPAKKTEAKSKSTLKVTKSKKASVYDQLNAWNWILSAALTAQAVAIIALSNDTARSFVGNFLTSNPLVTDDAAPAALVATRSLFNVQLSYLIAAILLVGAVYHLVIALVDRKRFEEGLKSGVSKHRWIENAVSGGLLLVLIGVIGGVTDITTSIALFGLAVISAKAGYLYEKSSNQSKVAYQISALAGMLPWLIIGLGYAFTYKYGDGGIPGYVLIVSGAAFAANFLGMIANKMHYLKKGAFAQYVNLEWYHMALGLVSKALVAWMLYNNLLS